MVLQNIKSPVCSTPLPTACVIIIAIFLTMLGGCAKKPVGKMIETTAYCGCGQCCGWERGSWSKLKLDVWNRYVSQGNQAGHPYSGRTASGTKPSEPQPGLFSMDSAAKPWTIPYRMMPWAIMADEGTIAADTRYYPFGTRMYVPGYGWGRVEDRGGAIKGSNRIDLYFKSHQEALEWGRKRLRVEIYYP